MSGAKGTGTPDVILERYRLGELPEAEHARVEGLLQVDQTLRRRLEELEASDREIRRRYPPAWLADRIRERLRGGLHPAPRSKPARSWQWPVPVALAAAAVVLLVLAPRTFGPPSGGPGVLPSAPSTSPDRIKGLEPSLTLFRRTPEGSETLADGAVARPGDQIRIGYRAAGSAYGVIVSVDGRGAVSVHLATDDGRSAALRSAAAVLLDQAFELDDAPLWERFYFVAAERPFALAPVVAAVRAAAPKPAAAAPRLPLPSQYQQFGITLVKEARP